jgi:Cdc6-like AAA superfamily ATPase
VSANTPPAPNSPAIDLDSAAFVALAFLLGPLVLVAAAGLAELARTPRRVWLWLATLPTAPAALLLHRFAERRYRAALDGLHAAATRGPAQLLLMLLDELWPVWLAALLLAPALALLIVLRRPRELADLGAERSATRREQRLARQAAPAAPPANQAGLFLGYRLAGERLLPLHRGRAFLPLPRLQHHLLVTGATGSGKTETVLRIADSLAHHAPDWTIVYIDGKGDRRNQDRFAELMQAADHTTFLFPQQSYDGWRGDPAEITGRLLQLIDFADQGGGAYYRDLAVNTIHLACNTPQGPPRSSAELLARLQRRTLLGLHPPGSPAVTEIRALTDEQLDGIRARYAAFFTTVGPVLDGNVGLDEIDTAYLLLDGLRLKWEAGYLARFLVEEFTQWAVARKPRPNRVLLIVDEFSAIAQAGQGLVDVVERTRGFGVAAILCPQLAEGMGSPEAAARLIGSAQTILLHRMATPEQFVQAGGTRRVPFETRQLEGDAFTGLGSARVEHEYRVDPNEVRRLEPGQCFAVGSGRAAKLQIAPTPNRLSSPPQHLAAISN